MCCPSLANLCLPLLKRGRRECRVHAAPAVSCAKNCTVGAHEHTGERKHSDIPCAMALRLISRSPRWSGLLSPSPLRSLLLTSLAPASRRQDHTTSPYAAEHSPLKRCIHRIPRPTCRDDGDTPLWWARDSYLILLIFGNDKRNILLGGQRPNQ